MGFRPRDNEPRRKGPEVPRKGEEGSFAPRLLKETSAFPEEPQGGSWGSSLMPPHPPPCPSLNWVPGFAVTKHHTVGRLMPTDRYPLSTPEAGRLS